MMSPMDRKYFYVLIFFGILILSGGSYLLLSKKSEIPQNTPLPTPTLSATIIPAETPFASPSAKTKIIKMQDGLQIQDEVVGTGTAASAGKKVTVNYVGTLEDGTKFDSSYDRNQSFSFNLGAGEVIKGWDEGVSGMKVGGKRKLVIPSALAYGDNGVPGAIPGGATLIFDVELLKVE